MKNGQIYKLIFSIQLEFKQSYCCWLEKEQLRARKYTKSWQKRLVTYGWLGTSIGNANRKEFFKEVEPRRAQLSELDT